MSVRLLLLITAWIIGLSFGVGQIAPSFLFVFLSATALATVLTRWKIQYSAAVLGLVILGFLWGGVSVAEKPLPNCPVTFSVKGEIVELISRKENAVRFIVEDEKQCRYMVAASTDTSYYRGDQLEIEGKMKPLLKTEEADIYAAYLLRKQVAGSFDFPKITVTASHPSRLVLMREYLQSQISHIFLEPEASLGSAMLFNQGGTMPQDVIDHFRITGVTHVLAISGSNITLLVALLLLALVPFHIRPWWRSLWLLILLWLYIFLIDKPVSAVRASYFWSIAIIAVRLSRLTSWPSIVLVTTAIMASLVPPVLVDIGFQLSLGAVIGIGLTLFIWRGVSMPDKTIGLVDILLSTIGATLITWPLIAFWFGTISLVSLPANLLVVPVMSLMYCLMVVTLLISFTIPVVALWFTFVVHLLWLWVNMVTTLLASLKFASLANIRVSIFFIVIYYAVLIIFISLILKKQGRTWREIWQ